MHLVKQPRSTPRRMPACSRRGSCSGRKDVVLTGDFMRTKDRDFREGARRRGYQDEASLPGDVPVPC